MARTLLLILYFSVHFSTLQSKEIPLSFDFRDVDPTITTEKIEFKDFPFAFNPSLLQTDQGILLSFRYTPDQKRGWISQCVMVLLDDTLKPISTPQIIDFRATDVYPPYFEDCKLFDFQGRHYALYSDCTDNELPSDHNINPFLFCREYVHLAEIKIKDKIISSEPSIKLTYPANKKKQQREKNWVPFDWNKNLYLSYYLFPHTVLKSNLRSGKCHEAYKTHPIHPWKFGSIRGTTPPLLVDGEYLAFFHSSIITTSMLTHKKALHYFIGAYTFSREPPFHITRASVKPIVAKNMYTKGNHIHAVFPCGFIISDNTIILSYGKDDREMWIAKIPKKALLESLVPVSSKE